MATIVKHEWHQVDSQFAFDLTKDVLEEIYPDMDEDELEELWQSVEAGEADLDEILSDAYDNDVEIDWDRQYDDWWTDRKGGYDITYEYGDDSSWTEPQKEPEPTHKCTNCKWKGMSYNTTTQYLREDGTVIDSYWDSEEVEHGTKEVCPMCDSEVELTEVGVIEEQEKKERMARWEKEAKDEEEPVPCFACGEKYLESSELIDLSGQYHCPSCGEGWVMNDMRDDEDDGIDDINRALEELKNEFETLIQLEEEKNKNE